MNASDDQYTITEAAQRIGVSISTIRRWIKSGKLKAFLQDRRYLIPADEVNRLAKQVTTHARDQIEVYRKRIRELEEDRAILQKQILLLQEEISQLHSAIESLTRSLPRPKETFREKLRRILRRGKTSE